MLPSSSSVDASSLQGWTPQLQQRGTIDIIWTCVITMSLCSWSVLCLNLPAQKDTAWRRLRRKFYLAGLGVMGPEFILQLALGQWSSAHRSVEEFRLAGYKEWSMKHAFFADMGGFFLQDQNWTPFPLNAKQVHYLVINKYVQYQDVAISEHTIAEKNKKEGFARFITVIQILWFVMNCIGRVAQQLALTTLELTTLGFIVCTIGTSFFWAQKPSEVSLPIVLTVECTIAEILVAAGDCASEPYHRTPLDFVGRSEWSWSLYWSNWLNTLRRVHVVFGPRHRPVNRVSNDNFPEMSSWMLLILFIFHATYAGLNLCGWNFTFPSPIELLLWRLSTCIIIGTVGLTWIIDRYVFGIHPIFKQRLLGWLGRSPMWLENLPPLWITDSSPWRSLQRFGDKIRNNSLDHDPAMNVPLKALFPISFFAVVYCFARVYILLEDFGSLRSLPATAYQTVTWSEYLPHIW